MSNFTRGLAILLLTLLAACSSPEDRAQSYYESGKEYLASGDYVRARLELQNALKYNEKLTAAWYDLATVEEKTGNWNGALQALERVAELDPKNVDALVKLARLQLTFLQLEAALKNVNTANDLRKDNDVILALRAAVLFRLGDNEGARADAEKALALNPDSSDAHAVLAADQLASGNHKAALQFVDRALSTDPKNLGLLLLKLKISDETKDDVELEKVLRTIIAEYPKEPQMRQALLFFLVTRKRFADAESEMRAMLLAEPENQALALDLARFVGDIRGPEAQRKEINQLIASHPDTVAYAFALVKLELAEKKIEAAKAILNKIISKGQPRDDVLQAKLQLAAVMMDLREIEPATAIVGEILKDDEKNADGLTLRARLKIIAGDYDGAVTDLRAALDQRPEDVRLFLLDAQAQERLGNIDVASDRLGQAVKISQHEPRIVLQYVSFLQLRSRNEQAENLLEEAVARHPRDRDLLTALGRAKLIRQDWVGAQRIAETMKRIDKSNTTSDQMMAAALVGQKKYEESISILKSVQADASQSTALMRNIVVAYLSAQKATQAESFLETMLATNPRNTDARVLLGLVQMSQEKSAAADATFREAIKQAPKDPNGYLALAKKLVDDNNLDEATAVLQKARSEAAPNFEVSLGLASILEKRGDYDGAIAVYEAQFDLTPDIPVIRNNLASLLADHRSDEQSQRRAGEIVAPLAGVDVPQFLDTRGWVAYKAGNYAEAVNLLAQAAEKLPDNALVHYHLGMTLLALQRQAEAQEQLKKADGLATDGDLKERIAKALTTQTAD